MKHPVIAMRRHSGIVNRDGCEVQMKLPEGCTGLIFCFESKKAAHAFWGKDVELVRIEVDEQTKHK